MDRRRFLALCGAGLGTLAGCTGAPREEDPGGSTRSPASTGTPSGTSTTAPSNVAPLDGSWGSYRNDAGNTAGTDDPGPVDGPTEVWRRATATGAPATAPAAADGAFFVVTRSGVVYARAAENGAVRWIGPRAADAEVAPVAADGTAVVADGRTLAGLAAGTGEERWTAPLDGSVEGLASAGGEFVVAAGNGVAALAPDGTGRWRHPTEAAVTTPPGADEDTVTVGLSSGDVLALDAGTGDRRWRASVGAAPTFAPAVGDGDVYVVTGSELVALDGENGTREWTHETDHPVAAPPVATRGAVSFATLNDAGAGRPGTSRPGDDGTPTPVATDTRWFEAAVISLAPDGTERWRTAETGRYSFTGGPPESLPLESTGDRVLLSVEGDLHAYDAATGEAAWSAAADGVAPAVTDGVVSTGRIGVDAADGSVRWRFRTGSGVHASPAVVGNTVYAGSDDSYLYALAADTGGIDWAVPTDDMVRASPAVGDDAVYAGTMSGSLYAFDRADGTELWRADLGGQVQSPALADGTLYLGNFSRTVFAVDAADGTERWRTEVESDRFVALALAVADGMVLGGANGDLRAFDAADGTERWRAQFGDREVVQSSPAVADGTVFVNAGDSLRALDAADGSARWSRPTGGSNEPPAVHDGTVYAPGEGAVHAFDAADGTERWRSDVAGDLRLAVGDAVYGQRYDSPLLALDRADGTVLWRHGGFEGTTAPALAEEHLFVGDSSGRIRAVGGPE